MFSVLPVNSLVVFFFEQNHLLKLIITNMRMNDALQLHNVFAIIQMFNHFMVIRM